MKKFWKKNIASIVLAVFLFTGGFHISPAQAFGTELFSTALYSDATLEAYYRAEDATDSEDSGTEYDLTNSGSVTFTAGKFNNAFTFTDNAQYIGNFAFKAISPTTVSAVGWYKPSTLSGTQTQRLAIHDQSTGSNQTEWTLIYQYNSGAPRLQLSRYEYGIGTEFTANYSVTLTVDQWYPWVVTHDGSFMDLWLNGTRVIHQASTGAGTTGADNVFYTGPTGGHTAGYQVDDVAFFSKVLSESEILLLASADPVAASSPANIIIFE